jgi:DNA repair protein RAD16
LRPSILSLAPSAPSRVHGVVSHNGAASINTQLAVERYRPYSLALDAYRPQYVSCRDTIALTGRTCIGCLLMLVAVAPNKSPMAALRHLQKRTRTSRNSRNFVPNSSDNDDIVEAVPTDPPLSVRRILKEVSIPTMSSSKAIPTRGRPAKSKSRPSEQDSSNESPSLENSDYDTPGTSLSTTPAASIRRGNMSAQKSSLSKGVSVPLSRSSSLKRSYDTVLDSDEDHDTIDADAELALQMQMEEDDMVQPTKRVKTGSNADDLDSLEGDLVFTKAKAYRGKGKAKLDSFDDSDADSLLEELSTPPSYSGKGKGKAKAITRARNRSRSARSSAKKGAFVEDEFLSQGESNEEEFRPEELESAPSDLNTPMVSDSEDEPLMVVTSRLKRAAKRALKPPRGKKKKSIAEEVENKRRRARFAHIEDKWERKRAMNRERAEQQHPKLLSMWKDLEKVPVLETQKAEQPKSISRRLKPFQLEGLSWMIRQEKTHYKGGLLGDEMGMGKTIQAVSLIMSDYPAKEPTLVCVPPVALMQWSNEIREYTDNKLKVLVYHGTNAKCKRMSVKELRGYDVIMVSYNSLESLHRKETKGWSRGEDIIKEASPLHAIKFHRLILDEAHSIKSRNTGVAKACFALQGDFKWCLSGTPVQNRIGEFFSLLRFLEVRPFADYFCRSCDCEKLHWATDDDHMCVACNHGASEHISVFNQELLNPITGDDPELREDALTKLHMITARIMLRRMKRDHTNSMVNRLHHYNMLPG